MFVLIIDNKIIHKISLSNNTKYKGIVFYKNDDNWYINLKDNLYFDDEDKTKPLEEKEYIVKSVDFYYEIKLYVYDDDEGIDNYNLYQKCNFVIGDDTRAQILTTDPYLKETYLYFKDNKIITNHEVIINNKLYNDETIKEQDVVELLGIRIIFYDDYLYMNNFKIENRLNRYEPLNCRIKYYDEKINPIYYLPCSINDFNISKLEEFNIEQKNNNDLLKNILPSLIMCVSTTIMALSNYYSYSDSRSIITYIVMPICMFLTGIILPIIFNSVEKYKNKKDYQGQKRDYLNYLDEYKNKVLEDLTHYLYSLNDHYFDFINFEDKLFYAKKNTDDYLTVSLGKTSISKDFSFKKQNDKDINLVLNEIKEIVNKIENIPLYLDLKKYKNVSVVSKNLEYLINAYMLELTYKHHYDDLKIALYTKSNVEEMYNLPHLFINNKRLTISDERKLVELDQMKLEVPLVLFLCDHTNYLFTNDMIHILYFSNSDNDVYKDSNAIVKYDKNTAYLYVENKKDFTYFETHVDFKKYFNSLSKYSFQKKENDIRLKEVFYKTIKEYYDNHDSYLKANFAYFNDEILNFDIHESKYGPHGLIAGATGSGKSELIISFLLSLCINYPPDYLNIVLIDYKGGGILESLSYNGRALPHVVASISNLENHAFERLIISLRNECYERERMFNELSKLSRVSIMNYDDYLNNNKEEYGLKKLAHELIVVDEFAELKKQHPEQISELISLSRVGRSLGLHLILATQKPSGVVDDEIWSNAHFKLALKVFDENDSLDVIKCKDAAYLLNPGSFILKVDGNLVRANCIYTKRDINNNDAYSVSLLDECLEIDKTYTKQNKEIVTEASDYCRQIIEYCDCSNYEIHKLSYSAPTSKLRSEFKSNNKLLLGEVDDYLNNKVGLLDYELNEDLLLYSSRKEEINNVLNNINEGNRKCIVIGSKHYKGKNITDSLVYDDGENIEYLFSQIVDNNISDFILIVEDLNCLFSYSDSYLDYLCKLIKRNNTKGVNYIFITTNSNLNFKLISNFKNKVLIKCVDANDVLNFYSCKSRYLGDSFVYYNEPISIVPNKIETYMESDSIFNHILSYIPEKIEGEIKNNKYLIGIDLYTRKKIYAPKDIKVISNDEELLNIYKKAYKVNTYLYDYKLDIDTNNMLWIGEGIYSQRLFITNVKNDLNYNEGIYILNGHKSVIRRIDV